MAKSPFRMKRSRPPSSSSHPTSLVSGATCDVTGGDGANYTA
jgi:hypothetical protein